MFYTHVSVNLQKTVSSIHVQQQQPSFYSHYTYTGYHAFTGTSSQKLEDFFVGAKFYCPHALAGGNHRIHMLQFSSTRLSTLSLYHTNTLCSKKRPPFHFWITPSKINYIVWHKRIIDLSTSPVKCSHFTLGNPKKLFSTVYSYTSDYLRYLRRKQSVTHLPTPDENVTTLTYEMQIFSSDWRSVAFLEMLVALKKASCGLHWWLWKEPVWCVETGMSVKQCHSKCWVTTFCINAYFQSFSPLISRIVHHALLKFSPYCNKPLLQLIRITDWYSIHVLLL